MSISGFRRDADEICTLLGYGAASCIGPILNGQGVQGEKDFFTLENGTETLSRNVGKQLPHDAA
jgi:hypothetical protein